MAKTITDASAATIIISDWSQGQIVQRGAAIIDGRIYRVTRDRSEGTAWTVGKRLSPRKANLQLCYELANER